MSLSGWKLFDRLQENLKFCLGLQVPKQLAFCPCLEPHLHSILHILTTGEGQSCLNVNLAGFFFYLRVLGFTVFSIWNLFFLVIYKADSSLLFRSQCKIILSRRPFLTSLLKYPSTLSFPILSHFLVYFFGHSYHNLNCLIYLFALVIVFLSG